MAQNLRKRPVSQALKNWFAHKPVFARFELEKRRKIQFSNIERSSQRAPNFLNKTLVACALSQHTPYVDPIESNGVNTDLLLCASYF